MSQTLAAPLPVTRPPTSSAATATAGGGVAPTDPTTTPSSSAPTPRSAAAEVSAALSPPPAMAARSTAPRASLASSPSAAGATGSLNSSTHTRTTIDSSSPALVPRLEAEKAPAPSIARPSASTSLARPLSRGRSTSRKYEIAATSSPVTSATSATEPPRLAAPTTQASPSSRPDALGARVGASAPAAASGAPSPEHVQPRHSTSLAPAATPAAPSIAVRRSSRSPKPPRTTDV